MNNALAVRFCESEPDLIEKVHNQRQRGPRIWFLETRKNLPIQVFHDQVCDIARGRLGDAEIGDVDDVGMPQPPASLRFCSKTRQEMRLGGPPGCDDLNSYCARGTEVRRQVYVTHAARAELLVD